MSHLNDLIRWACTQALRATVLVPIFVGALNVTAPRDAIAETPSVNSVGVNLAGVSYYSAQQPFINILKTQNGWSAKDSSGANYADSTMDLDSQGYPKSMRGAGAAHGVTFAQIGTLVLRNLGITPLSGKGGAQQPPFYPSGRYVLLYDGEGSIKYSFDAVHNSSLSVAGRDVLDVRASAAGIQLDITSTDPRGVGNYIRNMRLIFAPHESLLSRGEIFNPAFIERIYSFKTLRFIDWMATNGSGEGIVWRKRARPTNAFWGGPRGVPIEIMVALCNQIQADCWFNMPALATDEYTKNFAQLVHSNLNKNSKVYVEFSNEVWNFWNNRDPLVSRGYKAFPSCDNDFCAGFNYAILRTIQVGKIWKETWGAESKRLIRVLAGQAAYADRNKFLLDFRAAQDGSDPSLFDGPASSNVDAFAIAPYFGGSIASEIADIAIARALNGSNTKYHLLNRDETTLVDSYIRRNITVDEVLRRAKAAVAKETAVWTAATGSLTRARQLPLLAYEGGQHLVASGGLENCAPLAGLLMAANRSVEMGKLTKLALEAWHKNGGGIFAYYNDIGGAGKWGSWGALENVMQTSSPKYDAIKTGSH